MMHKAKNRFGVPALVAFFFLCAWVATRYEIKINVTKSLPGRVYWLDTQEEPTIGSIVDVALPQNIRYQGKTLLKIVKGVPGDVITREGRCFYVNGEFVGLAKTHSLKGTPLTAGPSGMLGDGQYFLWTSHVDSYDSRYADIGWVAKELIHGVAHPIPLPGLRS